MTITCEKCSTRFVLDEARIPAQGARVRCSRCQHRFHVKPPPAPVSPDEIAEKAVEHSAPFDADRGREAPAGAREQEADGALDNPEFIFEPSAPAPRATPREAPASEEPRRLAEEAAPRAPEPAASVAPDPHAEPEGALDGGDSSLFGSLPDTGFADPEPSRAPDAEPAVAEEARAHPAQPAEAIGSANLASDSDREPGAPLGDVEPGPSREPRRAPRADTWRSHARDELQAPARVETAREAAPPLGSGAPVVSRLSRTALARWIPSAAASLLSVAVLAASVRVLHAEWAARVAPAGDVRGAGWIATDLEALRLRGATGQPVLVLRGSLVAEGSAPPPRVRAVALDAAGRVVGEGELVAARRLDDAELDAARIAAALAGESLPAQGPVRAFTALVALTAGAAERYRLELLPGSGADAR